MSLEEREIRRSIGRRPPPSLDPWPAIRPRLEERPRERAVLGIAAALLLFFAAAEVFRRGVREPVAPGGSGFRVTAVSREGRPASAVVIQPDANTIVVIPQ